MEGRLTLSDNLSDNLPDSLLTVKMKHRVGAVRLNVDFALTQPWTVLFGPSGSGKTTVLRAIAGFVQPDEGRIVSRFDGTEVVMTDTAANIFVKPHLRPVRMAAQGAALFPHMTVRQNIAFGTRSEADGTTQSEVAESAISKLRLDQLAEKRPATLSGGERQRVAIARAAAAAVSVSGGVLLLDEPFAGMDLRLRDELIGELRDWLGGIKKPVLSVTHDIGEAFQLEAEVIKIADGRVVEQGAAADVLREERQLFLNAVTRQRDSKLGLDAI